MFDKRPEPKKEEPKEGARATIAKHAAALDEVLKPEAKRPEPAKEGPNVKAESKKPEKKEEPPRRNRVSVLRDLVEDLESDSSFSDEQRKAFMELNRRLTRALAR